jgi:hypothetical protein
MILSTLNNGKLTHWLRERGSIGNKCRNETICVREFIKFSVTIFPQRLVQKNQVCHSRQEELLDFPEDSDPTVVPDVQTHHFSGKHILYFLYFKKLVSALDFRIEFDIHQFLSEIILLRALLCQTLFLTL